VSELLADYIDLAPFAEQVGRHPRTVRRWMDQVNGLPFVKLGNRILIKRESALEWIAGLEHRPNPRKSDSRRRRAA
jgi:excisionase family DNA binding protein